MRLPQSSQNLSQPAGIRFAPSIFVANRFDDAGPKGRT